MGYSLSAPLDIRFQRQRLLPVSATPAGAALTGPGSAGGGGVFAHVHLAGLDPEGVVDDAVHDRVGVDSAAEALVPVLLRVLSAEHRR